MTKLKIIADTTCKLMATLALCSSATADAHDRTVTVQGDVVRNGAFVAYYYDSNASDAKPVLVQNMKRVTQQIEEHQGWTPPRVPQTVDGADTKGFVQESCDGDPVDPLKKWEEKFSKDLKLVAYYSVDSTEPHGLRLLATENIETFTDAARQSRSIKLLCKNSLDKCSPLHATHFCSIPCGGGCCCP